MNRKTAMIPHLMKEDSVLLTDSPTQILNVKSKCSCKLFNWMLIFIQILKPWDTCERASSCARNQADTTEVLGRAWTFSACRVGPAESGVYPRATFRESQEPSAVRGHAALRPRRLRRYRADRRKTQVSWSEFIRS